MYDFKNIELITALIPSLRNPTATATAVAAVTAIAIGATIQSNLKLR